MNETGFSSHVNPTSMSRSSAHETRTSLKDARFAHRTEALFRALSSDFLLREQFVSDPARTFAEYVLDERVGEDLAETANHLLYAVVSSQRLAQWLISSARQGKGKVPSRHAFATSLAQAVAKSGDDAAVLALIHAAASTNDHFSLQADLLRAIAVALGGHRGGGSSGTESTPGPGPGTDQTPGPSPGTEVSPGRTIAFGEVAQVIATIQRVIRGNPRVFTSGTESTPGPGPGTDQTPGPSPGTEVSPGRRISIAEMTGVLQLIQQVVRRNRGVFSSGTEFTPGPGPGTDQTPGPSPGTEVSLGRVLSAGELSRVLQAIQLTVRKHPGAFSSGTESTPGPGPGTDQTPGPSPGTEVSPGGRVFTIAEMTRALEGIQRAVRLNPGAFSSGTEMTPGPGPGTDKTPGPHPGTESTPASIFRGLGYLSVTMEALTRYAFELRSNQALQVSGVEGH
jgi:hypothetical protein